LSIFNAFILRSLLNERTGTVLNRVQVPTDIVFLFWRLRYKLSLRDLAGALANAGGSKCS
jgi:hypothetical protein